MITRCRPLARPGLALLLSLGLLAGCATELNSDAYDREHAMQAARVETGVVEDLRPVQIKGTQSGLGSIGGSALGGVAGNTVGGGHGQAAATIIGAIAGAVIGDYTERGLTASAGVELIIRLDSGRLIAVVQQADTPFAAGDPVRVITSGDGVTRVSPLYR